MTFFFELETYFFIDWMLAENNQQRLDRLQKQEYHPAISLQHHDLIDNKTWLTCQLPSYMTEAGTIL
jgi:hypothetical protein